MKDRSRLNGERGAVLVTSVMVFSFLAVLGMSLMAFLSSRIFYSQLQLDRLKAIYLAEAGIAKAIWELRFDVDPDNNGTGNIAETGLGEGVFRARHDFQSATITATGRVNRITRVVQIKYNAI
jgi:Tfp pilus assembly protein PilX